MQVNLSLEMITVVAAILDKTPVDKLRAVQCDTSTATKSTKSQRRYSVEGEERFYRGGIDRQKAVDRVLHLS